MATNDGRVLGIQTKYNAFSCHTTRNDGRGQNYHCHSFLKHILQSQALCNMSYKRIRVILTTIYKWQQKEILQGRSFTLSCSLFSVLLSGNSCKADCKISQPLEDETGYKEAKMKAVDSDFGLSVH